MCLLKFIQRRQHPDSLHNSLHFNTVRILSVSFFSNMYRPVNWVIDGLPPIEEVWKELSANSHKTAKVIDSRRILLEARRKAEVDAKRRMGEAMEEEDDMGLLQADPQLLAAKEAEDKVIDLPPPVDPLPYMVIQLKDGLPDYALLIHRLYALGFGPLKGKNRGLEVFADCFKVFEIWMTKLRRGCHVNFVRKLANLTDKNEYFCSTCGWADIT